MFPSLAARETYVAETNFAARKQKMFLPGVKNIFVSRTHILGPKHMFPSLATMKTMLTRLQCRSLSKNCLLSVLTTIKWLTAKKLKQVTLKKKKERKEKGIGKTKKSKCSLRCMRKGPVSGTWVIRTTVINRDNPYLGLSFGFLHLRRPNKLLLYTK